MPPGVETGSMTLVELVEDFRNWESTRPIDKILSLLHISSNASGAVPLLPDYSVFPGELARRLVQFNLSDSTFEVIESSGNGIVFELEGLYIGEITSPISRSDEEFWTFKKGEKKPPDMEQSSLAVDVLEEDRRIWVRNDRPLEEDTFAILLRGSIRPTAVRLHEGEYIVDMPSTPEPFRNPRKSPPSGQIRTWSEGIGALANSSAYFKRIKLYWNPYQHAYKPNYKDVLSAENLIRHYELMQEYYRDVA
ncbi:MAG: hypothetical protein L6R41_003593 [Letrouitia leprolyta]|nr:MAG: hypothetical protein L6R41_003593 [Letrouitia leprolyta]